MVSFGPIHLERRLIAGGIDARAVPQEPGSLAGPLGALAAAADALAENTPAFGARL
jgi:hypothetical protein